MATQSDPSEEKVKADDTSADTTQIEEKDIQKCAGGSNARDDDVTDELTDIVQAEEQKKIATTKSSSSLTMDANTKDSPTNLKNTDTGNDSVQNPYQKYASRIVATDATASDSTCLPETSAQLKKSEDVSAVIYPQKRKSPNINIMMTADMVERFKSATPHKQHSPNINIMNTSRKKGRGLPGTGPITLLVEGYAFHDDIIGVAHRKSNGDEAFNLTLCNMIFNRELEDEGFSSYVTLRDKSSGQQDLALNGEDGYPRYLFLSINVHHYVNATEANEHVLQQCRKLQMVRTSRF